MHLNPSPVSGIFLLVVVQSPGHVGPFCNPMDCSPPGSFIHGISQARTLEWVAISFSGGPSQPRQGPNPRPLHWQLGSLPLTHQGSSPFSFYCNNNIQQHSLTLCMHICQSLCLTLCDPMDCSPPGSSVHGILLTRILEWVAIPVSSGSSPPRDQTRVSHTAGRFFTI